MVDKSDSIIKKLLDENFKAIDDPALKNYRPGSGPEIDPRVSPDIKPGPAIGVKPGEGGGAAPGSGGSPNHPGGTQPAGSDADGDKT